MPSFTELCHQTWGTCGHRARFREHPITHAVVMPQIRECGRRMADGEICSGTLEGSEWGVSRNQEVAPLQICVYRVCYSISKHVNEGWHEIPFIFHIVPYTYCLLFHFTWCHSKNGEFSQFFLETWISWRLPQSTHSLILEGICKESLMTNLIWTEHRKFCI